MKFIKIDGGADTAYAAPVGNLLSIHADTNAKLSVTFKSSLPLNLATVGTSAAAATKAYDEIIFSITEDKEDEAVNEILELLTAVGTSKNNLVIEIGTSLEFVGAVDSITLGVS